MMLKRNMQQVRLSILLVYRYVPDPGTRRTSLRDDERDGQFPSSTSVEVTAR